MVTRLFKFLFKTKPFPTWDEDPGYLEIVSIVLTNLIRYIISGILIALPLVGLFIVLYAISPMLFGIVLLGFLILAIILMLTYLYYVDYL
jgi:hypothetical protein